MKAKVTERFLRYAQVDTASDENSETCPSSEKEWTLAKLLVKEMLEMGIADARADEHGYVYGTIAANCPSLPSIGLIAHMDTVSAGSSTETKPHIVHYAGGDVLLNDKTGDTLKAVDFHDLANHIGENLIVTDGSSVLGSDDKAGVAEIMTLADILLHDSSIRHGKICIGFTPDEEIGRGADLFDVADFGADFAYTVDGGSENEIEYENFNAASASVVVHGINIHPGSAKNKMKNAAKIGIEFNAMLPVLEVPENTEGYEGFNHLIDIHGDVENCTLRYIIRDHSMEKFNEKKESFAKIAAYLNDKYGAGTVETLVKDSYYNMREKIEPHMDVVERAKAALVKCGLEPACVPVRGGTDGARLSYMGLPCPNLGTGGHNLHSTNEYVSVQSLEKVVDVLVEIVRG